MLRLSSHRAQTITEHGLWMVLSLAIPLYYGLQTLAFLANQPYVVQDDARQHIVWFQRLLDPDLFPQDWIADYFQAIAPLGYKAVYGLAAQLGIEPLELARFLPLGLALIATVYLFKLTFLLFPVPAGAFLATLILNQQLWLNDDLLSATPRAFVYPIFAAFLYYLARRSLLPCLLTIGLQGLFFPQLVLVQAGMLTLRLVQWRGGRLVLSGDRCDYQFWLAGVGVAILSLLPFALSLSEFGAAITAEQMRQLPEYQRFGRSEYFGLESWNFWLNGSSGLRIPVFPSIILVGFALPWTVARSRAPLRQLLNPEIHLVLNLMLASLGWYGLAHLLLLRLHFPSRYLYHSWRFALAIAAGITLTLWLESGWRWLQWRNRRNAGLDGRDRLLMAVVALVAAVVVVVPGLPVLFLKFHGWIIGTADPIYAYLQDTPNATLVAALINESNNLPAFAQRSTLVGREFALSHHPQYYEEMRQRMTALVEAQYSPDRAPLQQAIARYGIDYWLVDSATFTADYLRSQDWLYHSSIQLTVQAAIASLEENRQAAIVSGFTACTVAQSETLRLLDAQCLVQSGS